MTSSSDRDAKRPAGPARGAWEDAQRQVRERNDAARRVAKERRAEDERRSSSGQRERDERDGVFR